ncbi:histidine protein methyltransferase 1 homolog [Hyalella azteca]|uniref:protein-histidine N-methyltransferase n=1 Tax=Hyalella azteca TaxID=294128 RepID=A0A8B7NNC3_HYAAZ|nr:histidine protein methyltransferase 1 homolog [Hyalella azteca]
MPLPSRQRDCQTDTASPDVKLTWEPAHWYKVPNDRWEQIIAEPAELEEQLCRPLKIKFLSQNSITHVVEKCKESSVIKISEEQQSDLIPAVYEGGLKIWECTWDLLHYLAESSDILWQGKRVLELGCGAGILGIYAVLQGASVTLQDYNEDVIEHITAPNVLYNVAELTETSNESGSADQNGEEFEDLQVADARVSISRSALQLLQTRVQFCSGDWGTLPELLGCSLDPMDGKVSTNTKQSIAILHKTRSSSLHVEDNIVKKSQPDCDQETAHCSSLLSKVNNSNDKSLEVVCQKSCDGKNCQDCDIVTCRKYCLTEKREINSSDAGLIENMHVQSNELSQFDVIMTSETIYNQENYEKILKVFTTCLKPHGVVLLAAKSYYFGVGGGTASFLAAVERTGCLQHKKLFEHTSGVRREIIEIRRVPYYILLLTLFCQSSESVTFQSPKNLFEQ